MSMTRNDARLVAEELYKLMDAKLMRKAREVAQTAAAEVADTFMDINEAAAFLKISPRVLRRKCKEGKVPCSKPSGQYRFSKLSLTRYQSGM